MTIADLTELNLLVPELLNERQESVIAELSKRLKEADRIKKCSCIQPRRARPRINGLNGVRRGRVLISARPDRQRIVVRNRVVAIRRPLGQRKRTDRIYSCFVRSACFSRTGTSIVGNDLLRLTEGQSVFPRVASV